tara:strand:+ start:523 stop:639 length:117 start_codon:yes stop_codon:yes gene_type:complete
MNIKDVVKKKLEDIKKDKEYKRKIEELKKRDPFVYKNF